LVVSAKWGRESALVTPPPKQDAVVQLSRLENAKAISTERASETAE